MRIIDSVEILTALDEELETEIKNNELNISDRSDLLECQVGIKRILIAAMQKKINRRTNADIPNQHRNMWGTYSQDI